MTQTVGKQSLQFDKAVHILSGSSVVGKKEGEGPLGAYFDVVDDGDDQMFGEETWEEAESALQKEAAQLAIVKAKLTKDDIRYIYAGDLLGQLIATSFGLSQLQLPMFGLYGACSTMGEALSLGAMTVCAGYAEHVLSLASSHFGSAEKQFRFPLGYANQRPLSATWTVTGSGAFVLGTKGGKARITGITTGKIVDYGIKDSMNMGASMSPAACDTIFQNFQDFQRQPEDYDKIFTGDLGYIGQEILIKLLKDKGYDISKQHSDCGIEIYDRQTQDTHSGGSGCGCSAVTLAAHILPKVERGEWKRVLFVPTGALHSTVSFNEGQAVPGIAHAVVIEHC
ncbi:MAG TPA: stage V sporulation protein AD [Candidatus Merdenecus merdavium]|nr:stage V sporulation protein AD [Candidatus Merdenecus merdavium]